MNLKAVCLGLTLSVLGVASAIAQPLTFPTFSSQSALGFFDPRYNAAFNQPQGIAQSQVAGAVAASAAQAGQQGSFSSSQKRYKDFLDLESVEANQGAFFAEPAWTLGKGNTSIGLGYTYSHYDQFNGKDLDDIFDVNFNAGALSVTEDTDYSLESHVWSLSYGKGITDDLDVFIVIPLVLLDGEGSLNHTQSFPPDQQSGSFSESELGIGDISLRTKYAICQDEDKVFSIGGDLVFPTGDEEDLLGGGDFGYRVRALYSKKMGNLYPTIEIGYYWTTLDGDIQPIDPIVPHLDAGDFDQFEYRIGLPWACNEKATYAVEWIGSISNAFTQNDLAFSGRFDMSRVKEGLVLDAGLRIPIDDDGLRTLVTPFVGVEYRF